MTLTTTTTNLEQAEQAHSAAIAALAEATDHAADLERRLAEGDTTVTTAELVTAPTSVRLAEARVTAAAAKLREVEDTQGWPDDPEVFVSPAVEQALADAAPRLDKLRKEVEAGSVSVGKARATLERAEAKRADALEGLEALEAATPAEPTLGVMVGNLLTQAEVVRSHVEVTSTHQLSAPGRGRLPLLRVQDTPNERPRLTLEYLTKLPSELPPDAEAITRALRLDGWRGDCQDWSSDGLTHHASVDLRPMPTLPGGALRVDLGGDEEATNLRLALKLYDVRAALGRECWIGDAVAAPLAHAVDGGGLHRILVGVAQSFHSPEPLSKTRASDAAMAKAWAGLVGVHDYWYGVVTGVEAITTHAPTWTDRIALTRRSGNMLTYYAEVQTVFRVADDRILDLSRIGLES